MCARGQKNALNIFSKKNIFVTERKKTVSWWYSGVRRKSSGTFQATDLTWRTYTTTPPQPPCLGGHGAWETSSYVARDERECFQKPLVTASVLCLQAQVPHKASQPNANSTKSWDQKRLFMLHSPAPEASWIFPSGALMGNSRSSLGSLSQCLVKSNCQKLPFVLQRNQLIRLVLQIQILLTGQCQGLCVTDAHCFHLCAEFR